MALQPNLSTPVEGSDDAFAVFKKVEMTQQKTWIFGAVSADETVPTAYPIGFNETTGNAGKWMAPDPTTQVAPTAATIDSTVNGIAIAQISAGASATAVKAAFKAIGIEVTVEIGASATTISFTGDDELANLPTVTGTGTITAGTASYGLHKIKGIVWPEPIDLLAAGEVGAVVMVTGNVDYSELEDVVDAGDVDALKEACQTDLLPRGLNVQNLTQVR